jgi:hypothetical protein
MGEKRMRVQSILRGLKFGMLSPVLLLIVMQPAGRVSGAPDMTDRKWQAGVSEKRMTTSISRGRGAMPGFDGKLSQDEIVSLVSRVRKFKD